MIQTVKSLAIAAGLLAGLLVACQPTTSNSETNKVAVNQFYEAFNSKDLSLLDQALTENWEDIPRAPGQTPGREGAKPVFKQFFTIFPDMQVEVQDVVIEGNKVAVRATITGTHRGRFLGVDATGRTIRIQAIDLHQLQDGKIVRTWHVEDWATALSQMGALE